MQTLPLKKGQIYMKDAHCAEMNEKSISRFLLFLFFEIWSFKFNLLAKKNFDPKDEQCSETNFLIREFFLLRFLIFEL